MDPFSARLDQALKYAGREPLELANHLGVKVQGIYQLKSGTSKSMNAANCARAARFLGVSPFWLATGEGDMVDAMRAQNLHRHLGVAVAGYGTQNLREVPVIGKSMGGLPDRIWDDGRPKEATTEYCLVATTDERAFIVRVDGTSMAPRYNPGEFALVEPSVAPDLEDDVLVRLKSGETLLKRLLSRRGGIRLGSWNPAEATIIVEPDALVWMYYVAHPIPARRIKSRA